MARSKSIEQQVADIALEDESYQTQSIARMRKKGIKKEMMMNFFSTVQSLAKMDSRVTTTDDGDETNDADAVIDDASWDASWDPPAADALWDEGAKLNWRKYKITENDKRTLTELRERKMNRMIVDLNSARNTMKMKECLAKEIDEHTTPQMIDNMLKDLFQERQKQVNELEPQKVCDAIDGKSPSVAVIQPPPGLGLFNFSAMNSQCIHQFEIWCESPSSAKFIGLLVLNKGRHDKVIKLKYIAHPIINGVVVLMVETDDQFYFGARFVEGCGQMQIYNPAQKYMEDVIGINAGQDWRTKCWNAIQVIKDTEYAQPMNGVGADEEKFPGFDSFVKDPRTIWGSIPAGSTTDQEITKGLVTTFIKNMNFLIDVEGTNDFADGPAHGFEEMEEIQRDIDVVSGVNEATGVKQSWVKEERIIDVGGCLEKGCLFKTFEQDCFFNPADSVEDEVFLPPSSTPKRSISPNEVSKPKRSRAMAKTDEPSWFTNLDEGQRDFKSLFPVAFEVTVPWKEKGEESDKEEEQLLDKVRVVNPMGLKVKIPFKDATKDSQYLMAKYQIFKGPKADLILDGDKMTFVKHEEKEKPQEESRETESSKLIKEIQQHYGQQVSTGEAFKTPTTAELVNHLKNAGDDLEMMQRAQLEQRVNLWGCFQKVEGDFDDCLKQELPEHLLNNQLFYSQFKGKKVLEMIMEFHDDEKFLGPSGTYIPLGVILTEYGEYLKSKVQHQEKELLKSELC